MKKFFVLFLILVFYSGNLMCQKIEFYVGSGISKASMTELKEFQDYQLSLLEMPAEITENFPAQVHFFAGAGYRHYKLFMGLQYAFASTGSRISYSDYSGSFNIDMITSSHQFGPVIRHTTWDKDKLALNFFLHIPLILSDVTFKEYLRIYDQETKGSTSLSSFSFGINPGAEIAYKISILNCGFRSSYLFDTKGFLHKEKDRKTYVVDQNEDQIHTDWSGFRFELFIGFNFPKRNQ